LHESEIVAQFLALARVPGTSRKERPIIDELKAFLSRQRLDFEEDRSFEQFGGEAGNLICKVPGRGGRPLLLAAHVDTVSLSCKNPAVKDGRIVSTSDHVLGADDRVGVTVLVEILKRVARKEIDFPPLEVVFFVAEEVGLLGSRFLDYSRLEARWGINFDCSAEVGRIVVRAPSTFDLLFRFHGRSAHSAVNPEAGVNAIAMAARAIGQLNLPQKEEETVFNLGTIRGGRGNNVIPDRVEVTGELRAFRQEKIDHILQRVRNVGNRVAAQMGGRFEFSYAPRYGSFSLNEESEIFQVIAEACKQCRIPFQPIRYFAGSDANNFNQRGIVSVNVGLGYRENHSPREYIRIADLMKDVELGIRAVETAARWRR